MKHALITGGAKRIGRAIALALAKDGWNITIHYNTSEKEARELAKTINADCVQADLSNIEDIHKLAKFIADGNFTALINNASLFEHDDLDPDGIRHKAVNFIAPHVLSKALRKGAVVTLLDSTLPMLKNMDNYKQSRQAARADIATLAEQFAPNVRVNAISLGPVLPAARQSQAHFDKLCAGALLQKPVPLEDITNAVLFLLNSTAITGNILFI